MKLTRQIKFWLIVALIHVGVIYAFTRACSVMLVPNIVTASVVTTELSAQTDGVQAQDATRFEQASDAQTRAPMRSLVHAQTSTQPVDDAGVQHTLNAATSSTSSANSNDTKEQSAAQATAAFTAPTHIGGHLNNPKPPYPILSRDAGEEGTVTLSVMVQADGHPSAVDVVASSGFTRLDRSARDTVLNQYCFTPATQGGVPIPYRYRFDVHFNLQHL